MATASDIGGSEGSNTGAQTVSHDDEFVVQVRGDDFVQVLHDVVANYRPRVPEAEFSLAAVAETRVGVGELNVGHPVADRV